MGHLVGNMNGKTLSVVIIFLIAGILIGRFTPMPLWVAIIPIMGTCALFITGILRTRRNPFISIPVLNECMAGLLFFGIGIFSTVIQRPATLNFSTGKYEFSGIVSDYTPTNYGDKLLISLNNLCELEGDSIRHKIYAENVKALITLGDATNISYGSSIRGVAELKPIDAPANYLNVDYTGYLQSKDILLTGFSTSGSCTVNSRGYSLISHLKELRDVLEMKIERTPLQVSTKNFLISILLGDKSFLNKEDRIIFSDAGVAHIFAVSGFHVSMIGLFVVGLLSLVFTGNRRKWKYLLSLPIIWFYILLVGASPSTCRAGIMLTIAFTALFLQRKNRPLRALGWSVILILALYPSGLFDIGFQLSVVCVGALLLIVQPLTFVRHRHHPFLFKIASIILVTLVATFSSWIIVAFYFHKFSLMFLPMNLVAVPLIPVYVVAALIYLLFFYLGLDLTFLGNSLDFVYDLFQKTANHLTSITSTIDNLYPGALTVFIWIGGVGLLAYALNQKKPWRKIWIPSSAFALTILILFLFPAKQPKGFIIQKNNEAPTIMSYETGKETLISLPLDATSTTILNGKNIVILSTSSPSADILETLSEADFILLCKGCNSLPEGIVSHIKKGGRLVTHPTLHWSYERKILAAASEAGLAVHSIRYDGALHIFD